MLLKKAEVIQIEVPHYDELSIKKLWPDFKKDPQFHKYFPSKYPQNKGPPRKYFFDILNTVYPDYLKKVTEHANSQRMAAGTVDNQTDSIKISKFWEEELKSMPYISCKY